MNKREVKLLIDFIKYSLQKFGIKYLARKNLIESDLNYYYVLFKSVRDEYCQFEVFFNLTDYFPIKKMDKPLLLGSNAFHNKLEDVSNAIEIYPDFQSAKDNSLLGITKAQLHYFFKKNKNMIETVIRGYNGGGIGIGNIHVFMKPSFIIIVEYECLGVYMKPIQFILGKKVDVIPSCDEERNFIDFLNQLSNKFKNFYREGVMSNG